MATDGDEPSDTTLQRLSKKQRELEEANADLYNKIAERDTDIEALSKRSEDQESELKKLKRNYSAKRDEADDLSKKNNELTQQSKAESEKHKLIKGAHDSDQKRLDDADAEIKRKQNQLIVARRENHDLKDEIAEAKATNASLHEQIDAAEAREQQIQDGMQKNADAQSELEKVNADFEHIFQELGQGLTVQDYINHVRAQEQDRLRRQSSNASLDRLTQQPQLQKEGDRMVSRSSVEQELFGTDYWSDQESEEDKNIQDADPTLTSEFKMMADRGTDPIAEVKENITPVAAPTPSLEFSGITSVETASVAPQSSKTTEPGTNAVPFTLSNITSQGTAPVPPPTQPLALSDTTSLATAPVAPLPQSLTFSRIITQATTPIASATPKLVRTVSQNHVPWYYTLLLLLALTFFVIFTSSAWVERSLWLAANDMSRQRVISLTMGSGSSWLTAYLLNLEDMIGVDRALLG